MPVTPLSPLHGQLDRNYGQAAARILLARLSSRLRLQTAHRAVCFTAQPPSILRGLTRTISHPQQSRTGFAGLIITWSCPIGLGQAA